MKKIEIDLDLFKHYYLEKNFTKKQCAQIFSVSISSIDRFVGLHNIRKEKALVYASIAANNIKKYGVPNVSQVEEVKQKIRQTCLDLYGVDNAAKANCTKQKTKNTCLERYGVPYTTLVPEFIEKKEQTNLKRYGKKSSISSDIVREKIKNTNYQRYGASTPFANKQILAKCRQTNLEKYGVKNPFQCADFKYKAWKKYYYKGLKFDSSWELALYIFAKDHNVPIIHEPVRFKYTVNNIVHYYTPDFLYDGKLIDIKGSHLLKDNLVIDPYNHWTAEELHAKNECIKQNNVKLLSYSDILFAIKYVENQYGKKYLKQFKNKKDLLK